MDPLFGPLITKLAEMGAGYLAAALTVALYIMERKRNTELIDRLHKLSVASLEANQEHTQMYGSINKALSVLVDIIKRETR